jgi:hypothetical protein
VKITGHFSTTINSKLYRRASTELITMGIERLIADAKGFADKDPEYFRFMLEILRRAN